MAAKVKICGLDRAEAVDAAVDAGAAMTGFVFYNPSPRNLDIDLAGSLIRRVPAGVEKLGLFVDPEDTLISEVTGAAQLDLLQLHGDETPERVSELKDMTGLPVMKVFKIESAADLERLEAYREVADRFLFDARAPKDMENALPGGNAVSFDWQLLSDLEIQTPWVLAGGLTAGNVAEAIHVSGADAVDVSSGVEDRPGVKNVAKIKAFVEAAASA